MKLKLNHFNSLITLVNNFKSDKSCRDFITEQRWGDKIVCPLCGGEHVYVCCNGDNQFKCAQCKRRFFCLVGTIFQNSKLPLQKWFMAMYLISSHKKGISSHQLSRDLDITQKTAWFMLQKIRLLYPQSDAGMFSGTVECDEVYIGGKEKWKHKSMHTPHTQGRSTKTKTPVFGMMERSTFVNKCGDVEPISYVHAFVVDKTDKSTLQPIIEQFVMKGSQVITDEMTAYNGLSKLGYTHSIVNHGAQEYAYDDIFTNSIEGFWSHFRRMILGCYHDVSDEHLQSYINEAVFRWNSRKMSESERFAHMFETSIGIVRRWTDIKVGLMVA